MSQYSLYGQRISETYPRLLQITSGDTVLDGSGDTRSLYVNGSFSADTIFIGSSDLNNIFAPIGAIGSGATTFIRNGLNTYTGGTPTSPTVNISAATLFYVSATTISGETLYSGATNLSAIILNIANSSGDFTRVQAGLNIYTGGTGNTPTINISAATLSYLSASTISGGTFYGDGSGLSGIGNSITVSLAWRFDSSTSETDPGNGDFRFNSTNPSSISKIYVDTTTSNGINASVILSRLKSGSEIYVQQKDNANTAILFSVTSSTIDNSGWLTIPVTYVSDNGGIVPQNNKDCLFILFNAPSIDSNTYVTGFTYDNANKLTIKQNDGISDLSAVINIFTGLTVSGGLSAGTFYSGATNLYDIFQSQGVATSSLNPTQIGFGSTLSGLSGTNFLYYSSNLEGGFIKVGYDEGLKLGNYPGYPFNSNVAAYYSLTISSRLGEQNIVFDYDNRNITYTSTNGHKFIGGVKADSLSATTFSATTTTATTVSITSDSYGQNSSQSPLRVYDGNGTITIGYNSSNSAGIWTRPTFGTYIEGESVGYGVFIPSKGGNTGLNVQNKVRIGDGQFNEGDTLEVVGTVRVSGYTRSESLSATNFSAHTIQSNSLSGITTRMVQVNPGGNLVSFTVYISDNTIKSLLEDRNNWYGGSYTGTTITGTFQGQKHYNIDYFFEAVENDLFIRIPRV